MSRRFFELFLVILVVGVLGSRGEHKPKSEVRVTAPTPVAEPVEGLSIGGVHLGMSRSQVESRLGLVGLQNVGQPPVEVSFNEADEAVSIAGLTLRLPSGEVVEHHEEPYRRAFIFGLGPPDNVRRPEAGCVIYYPEGPWLYSKHNLTYNPDPGNNARFILKSASS